MQKKELNIVVGKRIREIREYQRYTREQVAERADISTQFLADIENGNKSMTVPTIINLSKALHVSIDYMLLGKKPIEKNADVNADVLTEMLAALPKNKRPLAENLLKTFVEAASY